MLGTEDAADTSESSGAHDAASAGKAAPPADAKRAGEGGPVAWTVAIVTRDRADCLAGAIRSAAEQYRTGGAAEVLVVDNGSRDETPAVIARAAETYPNVRGVVERRGGLSAGRNRAIREARGRVVVFLDDDGRMAPWYLARLEMVWREEEPSVAGGPIRIEYTDPEPADWDEARARFRGEFTCGTERARLRFSRYPEGCNIAYDRQSAILAGGFDEDLGVGPRGPWAGEEMELTARIDAAGGRIVYDPSLRVTHVQTHAGRTGGWVLRTAWYRGRSQFWTWLAWYGERLRARTFAREFAGAAWRGFPWLSLAAWSRIALAGGALWEALRARLLGEWRPGRGRAKPRRSPFPAEEFRVMPF
jgi:glycosyltransferase involved in cell wall biosynthesis